MADKKTILVVDDEADVCTYLSTLLQDNGFETVVAYNGDEALAAVKKKTPDLVTLDITMPESTGVRFYKEMRQSEAWKRVPIVIVTGITPDFEKFISSRRTAPPPDGYLQKPIDPAALLALVRKHTGG
jgi:DNA-binding response OmpR family regulator